MYRTLIQSDRCFGLIYLPLAKRNEQAEKQTVILPNIYLLEHRKDQNASL